MKPKAEIRLSEHLILRPILGQDQERLYLLMQAIYPPVYGHMWEDDGASYLKSTYSSENLLRELVEPHSNYFFVLWKRQTIGILRILRFAPLIHFESFAALKLHRIYLSPTAQGKGIGPQLIRWTKEQSRQSNCPLIWLEAMDTQKSALAFYQKQGFQIANPFKLDALNMHDAFRGMIRMYLILQTYP